MVTLKRGLNLQCPIDKGCEVGSRMCQQCRFNQKTTEDKVICDTYESIDEIISIRKNKIIHLKQSIIKHEQYINKLEKIK